MKSIHLGRSEKLPESRPRVKLKKKDYLVSPLPRELKRVAALAYSFEYGKRDTFFQIQ